MPLSGDELEDERRKAKHLAMLQALRMIERSPNHLCSSCAEWREKCSKDSRRYCQDIEHLRKVVQKMLDTLAVYISVSGLRELVESLHLDTRMFVIHGVGDCYTPKDGSTDKVDMRVELASKQQELDRVAAERDLAKMQLFKVGRELSELKATNQDLDRQLSHGHAETRQRQRRLEKVEARIQSLETQSSCASLLAETTKLKSQSIRDVDVSMPVKLQQGGRLASGREGLSSSPSSAAEQQRLDSLDGRLGVLEQHGFIDRGPLPDHLGGKLKPCKPPVRARTPKEFELKLPEKYHSKGLRSRSKGGVKVASPTQSSSMLIDFDRGMMSRGQSSQVIAYGDRDLQEVDVASYLSRSHLGEPSRSGL